MAQDIDIGKITEELNLKLDIDAKNATSTTENFVKTSVKEELDSKVSLDSDQTIDGTKTFTTSPLVPTPADDATGQEVVNAAWCKENAGGGKDLNTGDKIYDWIGTEKEYREQEIEKVHPEYLCFITDDAVDPATKLNTDLGNLDELGQAILDAKANSDLDNLSEAGQAKLDAKANVSSTVTIDSDQTITGTKTFSLSATGRCEINMNTNQDISSTGNTWAASLVQKLNNTPVGFFESLRDSQGNSRVQSVAALTVDGTTIYSQVGAVVTTDGIRSSYAPTPNTLSSNSIEIATTSWVSSKFQVVSVLPATPDENVFYFIPE